MAAELNVQEKRRFKRFSVRLKVYSQETDEFLGYAENLHIEGLMISTKKPIPADQKIQIWFGASKEEKRLNRLFVTAYRAWTSFSDTKERFYYSGLHFVGTPEKTQDKIQMLIDDLTD